MVNHNRSVDLEGRGWCSCKMTMKPLGEKATRNCTLRACINKHAMSISGVDDILHCTSKPRFRYNIRMLAQNANPRTNHKSRKLSLRCLRFQSKTDYELVVILEALKLKMAAFRLTGLTPPKIFKRQSEDHNCAWWARMQKVPRIAPQSRNWRLGCRSETYTRSCAW